MPPCPGSVIRETLALSHETCIPTEIVDAAMAEFAAGRRNSTRTIEQLMRADHPCVSDEMLSDLAGHCSALRELRR